jgi:UDP-N-acetylmuramate dehydrogenase
MKLAENISLLSYNTFHIDAKAKIFAEYESVEELRGLLRSSVNNEILHIGSGSNLLFTGDYDGIILHSAMRSVRVLHEDAEHVYVEAESGVVMDELIAYLCKQAWSGMENLSYIPGEVGASAVQNVGAYGVEAKDLIEQVRTIDVMTGDERIFTNAECRFAYRDSIFKNELKGKYIITHVVYRLNKSFRPVLSYAGIMEELGDKEVTLHTLREAIIRIRKKKLPEVDELGSAGSFFKNPVVSHKVYEQIAERYDRVPHYDLPDGVKIPAAWLIEQCGWKGKMHGGAQCYEKQPLILVNTGNAKAKDIVELAEAICQSVMEKFGITISPEVNYIN